MGAACDAYGKKVPGLAVSSPVPVAADGLSLPVSIVAGGGGSVSIAPWSHALTTALAASLLVKAGAGTLGYISGRIDSSAPSGNYYIQVWNLAALPADATAVSNVNSLAAPLKIQFTTGIDQYFQFQTPTGGETASAGIVVGISTTEFTKTAAGNLMSATASFL